MDEDSDLLPSVQAGAADEEKWYYRVGAYAGYSELEDEASQTLYGASGGGRGEIGAVLGAFELGGRLSLGLTSVDRSDALGPGSTVDYTAIDIYLEPVFRAYLGFSSTRPYAEVFGGLAYASIDQDVYVPPNLSTMEDQGLGFTYGAGIGVEFIAASGISGPLTLTVGVELRETELDTDDFGDLDQPGVLGTILFGTRW